MNENNNQRGIFSQNEIKKIKLNGVRVGKRRLTVECHKFLNGLYVKHANHKSLRATLALSSLIRVGKILIYAKSDYHKLHLLSNTVEKVVSSCPFNGTPS